eukprot:scaffold12806_cov104-Isochrysis_galbana.AAC.13
MAGRSVCGGCGLGDERKASGRVPRLSRRRFSPCRKAAGPPSTAAERVGVHGRTGFPPSPHHCGWTDRTGTIHPDGPVNPTLMVRGPSGAVTGRRLLSAGGHIDPLADGVRCNWPPAARVAISTSRSLARRANRIRSLAHSWCSVTASLGGDTPSHSCRSATDMSDNDSRPHRCSAAAPAYSPKPIRRRNVPAAAVSDTHAGSSRRPPPVGRGAGGESGGGGGGGAAGLIARVGESPPLVPRPAEEECRLPAALGVATGTLSTSTRLPKRTARPDAGASAADMHRPCRCVVGASVGPA